MQQVQQHLSLLLFQDISRIIVSNTQANSRVLLIASILELSCVIFVDSLRNINRNPFFETLYHACLLLQNSNVHTDLELLREPVWAWLRQHCPSFADMSANAVFSDIFRLSTVGQMNMELKSSFHIQQTNQSFCCTCNHPIRNVLVSLFYT